MLSTKVYTAYNKDTTSCFLILYLAQQLGGARKLLLKRRHRLLNVTFMFFVPTEQR